MKKKKYSNSKIKTVQKFLSKYDLTFESLDEPQKKVVVNYTSVQKLFGLTLATFIISLIICISVTYMFYDLSLSIIDSTSEETVNFHEYGKRCLGRGFVVGAGAFTAFSVFLNTLILPLILRQKRQIFHAFLPALKQSSYNDKNSSD